MLPIYPGDYFSLIKLIQFKMYNFQRYVNYERSFINAVKQFINSGYKTAEKYSDD